MRILIIIPCYNEEVNIGKLLRELDKSYPELDILVIDDCSEDNTFQVANRYVNCVGLIKNLGIGGAVQVGIKYSYSNGYDFCVQVDGDGQHPPNQIQRLIDAYQKRETNIVVGSRFLEESQFQSTKCRRVGISIIRFFLNLLFRLKISDPTSGLRLMDRKAMKLFIDEYPRDFPEPISNAYAAKKGLTYQEVSVNMQAREEGNSSIYGLKSIAYMIRVIGYLILTRIGRNI